MKSMLSFIGFTIVCLVLALIAEGVDAGEIERNAAWCAAQHGVTVEEVKKDRDAYEKVIPGGRVDCVFDGYAIEADWTYKSDEGIGQAARYSQALGLKPGLLLLIGKRDHCRYIERARASTAGVWVQVGYSMHRLRVWWDGRELCE